MRPILRFTVLACAALALLPAAPSFGQHTDREQIIDIERLNQVMADATQSLAEPLRETTLLQRFSEVNALLQSDQVDKRALVASLDGLAAELRTFVGKLDSTPLFEAEQQVGLTIDRVRMLMATGPSGKPSREIKEQVEAHEEQLRQLVEAIDEEPDPRRQQRLKLMFAHHLRLKRLKQQMGSVDLSDARMRVLARTALALDSLSTQLISAAFRTEEARLILGQQSEFVSTYVEILNGLVGAEEIARVLNGLGDSGSQLAPVIAELATIASQAAEFGEKMDEVAMSLSDQIDIVGGNIADQVQEPELLLEMDLEREMDRYRAKAAPAPVQPNTNN
jgi:hypothetical protein